MTWFVRLTLAVLLLMAGCLFVFASPLRYGLCIFLVCAYLLVFGLGVAFIQMRFFCNTVCRGPIGGKQVALTFDDGPDPEVTAKILDILEQRHVPATFFCIGKRVEQYPNLLRRMTVSGHDVGNHSYRHAWWTNFLFGRYLREEIEKTQAAIRNAAGISPRYYRPPVGLTNPHVHGVLKRANLIPVGWSIRSHDLMLHSTDAVVGRVVRQARPGSIILLHDGGVDAADAEKIVSGIVDALGAQGFEFVCLSAFVPASLRDNA